MVVLLYCCPLTWLSLSCALLVLCHRRPSLAPASKAPENEDSTVEAEDNFTWKDVLKAVLRLRQKDKLSEGKPAGAPPQ